MILVFLVLAYTELPDVSVPFDWGYSWLAAAVGTLVGFFVTKDQKGFGNRLTIALTTGTVVGIVVGFILPQLPI